MFKKISAEEFDQLRIKGWARSSPTYNAIFGLHVGEAVVILKSQWRRQQIAIERVPRHRKKMGGL